MKKILLLAIALIVPAFAAFAETKVLDDAEILTIVITMNQAEIDAGNLARSGSSHPDIRLFALGLVEAHSQSNAQFNRWADWKRTVPQSSSISDGLRAGEEKFLEKLKRQQGILFDLDYINHEVESHQQAIDLLDEKLIPNAGDDELKHLLGLMRPMFVDHLARAKLIKISLGRKK